MSPDQQNGGGAFRRFSGVGNNAPQDFRAWKKWAKAKLVVEKSMGMTPGAVGPMLYTLLDGDASDSLDHIDIDQLAVDGGEVVLFEALEARYPEKEAADRVGEALDAAFGLRIEKGEASSSFVGRAKTVFMKAEKEGVNLPDVARGFLLLKGSKLGGDRRAVVLAASQRSWKFDNLAVALTTTYPRVLPEHGVHVVEGQDWDDENQVDLNDPKNVQALLTELDDSNIEPIDEEVAVEVLATWKDTRQAMNQEKLSRGFRAAPQPDLHKFATRVRCYLCKKIGHFSKDCRMRQSKGKGKGAVNAGFVECVKCDALMVQDSPTGSWREIDEILAAWEAKPLEELIKAEKFRRLAREQKDAENSDSDPDCEVAMVHTAGSGVIDPGCGRALIGLETLEKHIDVTGQDVTINKDHTPIFFRGFNGEGEHSIGVCTIPWKCGKHTEMLDLYVVRGSAGLLLSKPLLKQMKCVLDMSKDTLHIGVADVTLRLSLSPGNHYEAPLDGSSEIQQRQGFQ